MNKSEFLYDFLVLRMRNIESQVATSRGEAEHCLNMLVKEFFKPFYNKQRGKLKMLYANPIKKLFEMHKLEFRIIITK